MKEAFLMGIMAMGANADDNDINLQQVITPITINQDGKEIVLNRVSYNYAITAADTKADVKPQVVRHIKSPL